MQALGRTRVIGGQVEGGLFIAQLVFPVRQLARGFALGQPLALPAAVVGVLQRQRRQFSAVPLAGGAVEPGKLIDQDVQRPAIGDDVVQGHQQLMVLIVQAYQGHPQQGALLQVERRLCVVFAKLPRQRLALGLGQATEIDPLDVAVSARIDALHGLAIVLIKACTQGFMPLDQALEAAAHRRHIHFAAQAQGPGNVVRPALWLQLPEEPQAVLGQRLRQPFIARQPGNSALGHAAILAQPGHLRGEGAQGRCLEQQTQVELDGQCLAQRRNHLGGENRVAAQQEEVVVGADLLQVQIFGPDFTDQHLQFVANGCRHSRRHSGNIGELRVAVEAAIGQALAARRALQLAAGGLGQRTGVEQYHHARDLLTGLGHGLAQGLDQGLGREDLLHAAADFSGDADTLLTLDGNGERGNTALAHHLHFALDGLLDVLRIQVMPAHDQHVLEAASDVQLTVAHETQVAGAQPGAAILRDEAFRRGLGIAPIALGDARPGGPDFADAVVAQHLQALGLHHAYGVVGLVATAAHDCGALAGHGLVLRQRAIVQAQGRDALATLATGDKQRGLGQAVGGEIALLAETTGGELAGE
ncbi:hypothetical protein D3C76_519450 [compost metagenome]